MRILMCLSCDHFFATTTFVMWAMLSFDSAMNDKPWGLHATPSSYQWTVAIGAMSTVSLGLFSRYSKADQWQGRFLLWMVFWFLSTGTYLFLWKPLIMNDRTHSWNAMDE